MKTSDVFGSWRTMLLATTIAGCIFLQACNQDDEPTPVKDETAPTLAITSLTEGQAVWNTVVLTATATDDQGLDKVEIYADNALVATLTTAPFAFTWDSNTVNDGAHTIKFKAIDKGGNAVEKQASVQVKNTLLAFETPQGLSDDGFQYFVFLSDETGALITSVELEDGKSYKLKSEDFDGERFYVTQAVMEEDKGEYSQVLATATGIVRGSRWSIAPLEMEEEEETNSVGTANITSTNASNTDSYFLSSNGAYKKGVTAASPKASLSLSQSPSKLYVSRYVGDDYTPSYYNLYSSIVVGTNSINLSTANKPLSIETISLTEGTNYALHRLYGLSEANNFNDHYFLGLTNNDQGDLNIYYPGTAFPGYYSTLYVQTDDMWYDRQVYSIYDATIPTHQVTYSTSNNALKYSASGNIDAVIFYLVDNNSRYNMWSIITDVSTNQTIPVLELPEILDSRSSFDWTQPAGYGISDFAGITGYADMIKTIEELDVDPMAAGKAYVDIFFGDVKRYYGENGRIKNGRSRRNLTRAKWFR